VNGEDPRERLRSFAEDWQRRQAAHEASADRLRAERVQAVMDAHGHGVTQQEIAAILGVSQQFVSRILRGG
jgi:DNA-directed RNA polymerase specialized sigma subunit